MSDVSFEQLLNAEVPIFVTLLGIIKFPVNLLQPKNA